MNQEKVILHGIFCQLNNQSLLPQKKYKKDTLSEIILRKSYKRKNTIGISHEG